MNILKVFDATIKAYAAQALQRPKQGSLFVSSGLFLCPPILYNSL